jgi:hypothetical protein
MGNYKLGTWSLPSGRDVTVTAHVTIGFHLGPPLDDLEDRRVYLDEIMPKAVARLRDELAQLRWWPGEWKDEPEC